MFRAVSSLLRSPLTRREPLAHRGWADISQTWSKVVRGLRASATIRALDDFFPQTDNPVEEGERSGRPWLARELRHKSSDNLHKLWYVLLKERNMLLTVKQEANRALFIMPGPERIRKVRRSMARIKVVLFERENALKEAKRQLEGPESAETAIKKKPSRLAPYKLRKMFSKRQARVRALGDRPPTHQDRVIKKRRNVRNYKHISAVRELEQKE